MDRKLPQGAELKELYVGALRIMADRVELPAYSYDLQGLPNTARQQTLQCHRLKRLIESMVQLSPDHHLLNNPRLVPFVSMRDGDDVLWLVKNGRFLLAAKAHDWKSAEEWLTVALSQYDYMA